MARYRGEINPGLFRDRRDAGRRLAADLAEYESEHAIVLGLPRGGVPVAYEIARALHAPLDVWVARKVGVPWQPELGLGAVAEGGYVHFNEEVLQHVGLSHDELTDLVRGKQREVEDRVRLFRGDHPRPLLRGRTVIVVDDGIATGGSVRAAIQSIRAQAPKAIVLAVPVADSDIIQALACEVERVVCVRTPPNLRAVGLWYVDFDQVSDDEVARLLDRVRHEQEQAEKNSVS